MEETDQQKFVVRSVSDLVLTQVYEAQGRLQDIAVETSRWLMASLVTLNGGAMAAMAQMPSASVSVGGKLAAGECFTAGIVLALALGATTVASAIPAIPRMAKVSMLVKKAAMSGVEEETEIQSALAKLTSMVFPWTVRSWLCGIASAALFVVGRLQLSHSIK